MTSFGGLKSVIMKIYLNSWIYFVVPKTSITFNLHQIMCHELPVFFFHIFFLNLAIFLVQFDNRNLHPGNIDENSLDKDAFKTHGIKVINWYLLAMLSRSCTYT